MTLTERSVRDSGRAPRPLRRLGYAMSIGINLVLMWIVLNLVEWDVVPFLTEEFEQLVPIALFSIGVSVGLTVLWWVVDPPWSRVLGDAVTSTVAFVVVVRTLQVFPFAIEAGGWETALRFGLVFVAVATAIAALVNLGKLLTKGRNARPD